jgi:hypothetical protein
MISHAYLQHKHERGAMPGVGQAQGGGSTVVFATSMGASPQTTRMFAEAEAQDSEFDASAAATTSASTAIFITTLLQMKTDADTDEEDT